MIDFTDLPFLTESDLQPFITDSYLFDYYAVCSIFLLIVFSVLVLIKQFSLLQKSIPFLISEQFSFKLFQESTYLKIENVIAVLFIALQFTYLCARMTQANLFNVLIFFAVLVGVLFLKQVFYKSFGYLFPKRLEMNYFVFNYMFILSLLAIVLFLYLLVSESSPYLRVDRVILGIILLLFYLWMIVRWLFISTRYNSMRSIYFFLYLCALEIAPLIIGMKVEGVF